MCDKDTERDGVEVVSVCKSIRCPLTLRIMTDPAKATLCGHTFERAAIMRYIENADKAVCPNSGCSVILTLDGLISATEMQRRVKERMHKKKEAAEKRDVVVLFDADSEV